MVGEFHCFEAIQDGRVREADGFIEQVSLICAGDAKGHKDSKGRQVCVDDKTLSQIFADCKTKQTLKVKADHGSGVFATIGYIKNFALRDGKITGDLYVYDTVEESKRIFEIALKNPSHMGVSLEFTGEDEVIGDKCFARCDEVITAALVSDPAANSSLYEREKKVFDKSPTAQNTLNQASITPMDTDKTEDTPADEEKEEEVTLSSLKALVDGMTEQVNAMAKRFADEDAEKAKELEADPPADPEKEDDKLAKTAEMAAKRAVQMFAATLGAKPLAIAPKSDAPAKAKTFEDLVDAKAKELGDKNKAYLFCIKNHQAEYAATRKVTL